MARGAWTQLLTSLGLIRRRVHLLCIGLDNSGKTSILKHIRSSKTMSNPDTTKPRITETQTPTTIPTIGFTIDTFTHKQTTSTVSTITVFDMSGQGRYRDLWCCFYKEADAVVFVVDASDRDRVSVVRDELDGMLNHPALSARNMPILFYCNKMDIDGVLSPMECVEALGLDRIRDRPWTISGSSAVTGEGIDAGMTWLMDALHVSGRH